MNSKGWKVVVLALIAMSTVVSCAKKKKKNRNTTVPFHGVWINAEADRDLSDLALTGDKRFCNVVLRDLERYGISAEREEITLDAWKITAAGEVLRYTDNSTALATPATREFYLAGRVDAQGTFAYKVKSISGQASLVRPGCYQPPFRVGDGSVQISSDHLALSVIAGSGLYNARYVKVSDPNRLRALQHALADCSRDIMEYSRDCNGDYRRRAEYGRRHRYERPVSPRPGFREEQELSEERLPPVAPPSSPRQTF